MVRGCTSFDDPMLSIDHGAAFDMVSTVAFVDFY
jgi:hypothetical protein